MFAKQTICSLIIFMFKECISIIVLISEKILLYNSLILPEGIRQEKQELKEIIGPQLDLLDVVSLTR